MSAFTVACPHCKAGLRSSRPVPAGRMVRCPECGNHFSLSTTSLGAPPEPPTLQRASEEVPAVPVEPPSRPQVAGLPMGVAVATAAVVAMLLGAGIIVTALFLAHTPTPAPAPQTVSDEERRQAEREKRQQDASRLLDRGRLALAKKEYDTAVTALEEALKLTPESKEALDALVEARTAKATGDTRAKDVKRLVEEGSAALAKKDYAAAEKAFAEVVRLAPENKEAVDGLVEARTGKALAEANPREDPASKAEVNRLLADARKAMTEKQYAQAVRSLEEALKSATPPLDETVRKELAAAQSALDADAAEKQKLADYKKHMDAGSAHFVAGRYAEAVGEYMAAQRVVPGDALAAEKQRLAEARIREMANRKQREAAFNDLLARGKQALAARRYSEAVESAKAAKRIFPDDDNARSLERRAQDGLRQVRANYNELLKSADAALQLNRLEEALRLYTDASALLPEDEAAQKGLAAVRRVMENAQLAQAAYIRYMDQAAIAERTLNWAAAATAYAEALRVLPGDVTAVRGLERAQARVARVAGRKLDYDKRMQAGNDAMTRRQYADAVRYFTEAVRDFPDDLTARTALSEARYNRFMEVGKRALLARQRADAIKAFEGALEEKPGDITATGMLKSAKALSGSGIKGPGTIPPDGSDFPRRKPKGSNPGPG